MSSSFSSSSSFSNPVVPPEELVTQAILNSIAGVATNYANTLFNWGQNVFNGLSGDISGLMGKLGQAADTALTGAQQAQGQFTGSFIPDYNNLRTTAAQYANAGRQARNAGMAESDQMQANQSAINDATQKLESMGIDTSSGRYAHDLLSAKTAGAAAAAGAGTQSIRADEATALGLKKQALDYGIQFPGIAANFLNQANQANSIAGNLDIGKTNAGTALMQVPNAYLNTAMQDRYPPIGQQSRGSSSSQSQQPERPSNQSSRGPGSQFQGDPNPFGPQGPNSPWNAFAANHGNTGNGMDVGNGAYNGPYSFGGSFAKYLYPNDNQAPSWTDYGVGTGGDYGFDPYNMGVNGVDYNAYSNQNNEYLGGQTDPFSNYYGNYNTGGGSDYFGGSYGDYNSPQGWDVGSDPYSEFYNQTPVDMGGWDSGSNIDYNQQFYDNAGNDSVWNAYDTSGQNYTDYGVGSGGDYSFDPGSYDTGGGGGDYGFDYSSGDWGDYAAGGAIPDPRATTGGFVPKSASPSNGRVTDDIHASVNADEFIVPRDVALWKGQEYFQKLIAQSRKNLAQAGAKGKPAPAPTGPVRFASKPMGQR